MENSIIERDENEQLKFGQALVDYQNSLRTTCKNILKDLDGVEQSMQDESGKKALESIRNSIREIEKLLPGIEEFGSLQKVKANKITRAKQIFGR